MLKKYTSNKILSLMNNNDKNEGNHSATKIKKIKKSIKLKNSEEKNNSIKNSIFNKVIIKSNSIINSNNEHYLLNYKNKMPIKNSPVLPKNVDRAKNKNHLKTKIKTKFSNYYTDFIFKNNNNSKPNFNITEINYGVAEDTEDLSHIHLNNETNEDSLKTNRLKYLGLYNTDSSQKINFNTYVNNANNSKNNSKDNSPFNKGSILISPNRNKKINKENKKILVNSNKKIPKIRLGQNSETKNNNSNINNSNKNLKSYGNDYKKQKNLINSQKTNKYIKIKKEDKKKMDIKNKERNKENKIKMFDSSNKALKNINDQTKKQEKHIFFSPLQKNINSIIVKIKSSTKKINKINYNNYLSHYNTANSTSNKENKKIIFQRKENSKPNYYIKTGNNNTENDKNKQKINNIINSNINNQENLTKEKLPKLNIHTHANELSLKEELEVNNIETDIYKLMDEHKELTPSIVSEDKKTEKDLYLENNNNSTKNEKNLIDYFKTARKALKTMSHSLVDPINKNNNLFNDNEIKNHINEAGQISNRYKEDELHNYTIKKVPIFMGVNMIPHKKNKNCNNFWINIFSSQSKDKYNNIRKCIIDFLDDKSIMYFSCINKILFKNIRNIFHSNIYNHIYKNKKFVKKINDSLFKIVCSQLKKNKFQLELLYDSFPSKTSYNDIILNDLYRTFPEDSKFHKNATNYKKLYNILTKYSNYNSIIGYAQGLNFLFANALYLYDNEKKAFFYIDGLIRRFDLANFLAAKNSKLTSEINKFSKILSKYNFDILNYFDENLIYHDFFTNDWILTLFSNSMNFKNLLVCWNFMTVFGWKFFYCFVIQILVYYKSLIFKTKDNALSQLMKNLLKEKKFSQDLPKIINNTLKFMQKYIVL